MSERALDDFWERTKLLRLSAEEGLQAEAFAANEQSTKALAELAKKRSELAQTIRVANELAQRASEKIPTDITFGTTKYKTYWNKPAQTIMQAQYFGWKIVGLTEQYNLGAGGRNFDCDTYFSKGIILCQSGSLYFNFFPGRRFEDVSEVSLTGTDLGFYIPDENISEAQLQQLDSIGTAGINQGLLEFAARNSLDQSL